MKHPFILLALLCAFSSMAQTTATKPAKLRYNPGFFSVRYELGDKGVTGKDIRLHLEKHDAGAYHLWRRGDGARSAGWVWCGVAALGAIVGAATSTDTALPAAGWGVAAVGLTGVIVCDLNEKRRRERAIDTYNRKFGY